MNAKNIRFTLLFIHQYNPGEFFDPGFVMIQLLLRYGVLHNISLFMLPVFSCYRFLQRYRISSWYRSFHGTGFRHGTGLFTIRGFVMIQLLLRYGVLHNISLFMLPVFSCYRFLQRYRISSWYRSFHDTGFCII